VEAAGVVEICAWKQVARTPIKTAKVPILVNLPIYQIPLLDASIMLTFNWLARKAFIRRHSLETSRNFQPFIHQYV
jgi:hypothetical protein